MYFFAFKMVLSSLIIAFTSWLSGKNPLLAGLIIALPLMTLLSSVFSFMEYKNSDTTIYFVKCIFFGLPVGWLFFLPFMVADRFNWNFWTSYGLGVSLLVTGFITINIFKDHISPKSKATIEIVNDKPLEKQKTFSLFRKST